MMTRYEAIKFIEDCLDDTLENINFQLSMDTEYTFEDIEDMVDEAWDNMKRETK